MKLRTFIAIDPSPEVTGHLVDAIDRMRQGSGGIRWLRGDQFHLTLRFLGSVEEEVLEKISSRLEELGQRSSPLTLLVRGIGFFPSPDRPRIVWAGIDGETEGLRSLYEGVEGVVQGLTPVSKEERNFRPHITIGRVHEPHKRYGMQRILAIGEAVEFGQFIGDQLLLYKSDLTPRGARYTKLQTFKLGG